MVTLFFHIICKGWLQLLFPTGTGLNFLVVTVFKLHHNAGLSEEGPPSPGTYRAWEMYFYSMSDNS